MYSLKEPLRRGVVEQFLTVLRKSAHCPTTADTEGDCCTLGCGLSFLAKNVEEHYANETKEVTAFS